MVDIRVCGRHGAGEAMPTVTSSSPTTRERLAEALPPVSCSEDEVTAA